MLSNLERFAIIIFTKWCTFQTDKDMFHIPTSKHDLAQRANRVWKELRDLNIKEGFDDSYEKFPEEWFGENGFKDYITGKPLTIDQAEKMKLDYYKEWRWTK